MGMGLLLCYFCHEISSSVRSSVVWETMMVDKALLYKSKVNGMGKTLQLGKRSPCSSRYIFQ